MQNRKFKRRLRNRTIQHVLNTFRKFLPKSILFIDLTAIHHQESTVAVHKWPGEKETPLDGQTCSEQDHEVSHSCLVAI